MLKIVFLTRILAVKLKFYFSFVMLVIRIAITKCTVTVLDIMSK